MGGLKTPHWCWPTPTSTEPPPRWPARRWATQTKSARHQRMRGGAAYARVPRLSGGRGRALGDQPETQDRAGPGRSQRSRPVTRRWPRSPVLAAGAGKRRARWMRPGTTGTDAGRVGRTRRCAATGSLRPVAALGGSAEDAAGPPTASGMGWSPRCSRDWARAGCQAFDSRQVRSTPRRRGWTSTPRSAARNSPATDPGSRGSRPGISTPRPGP